MAHLNELEAENFNDDNGNPAGGHVKGIGLDVVWQNGPLMMDGVRREQNGAFVEDLVRAAIQRINYYQESKFSCRENALAITKLEEALHWMNHRTAAREARGVEGTHTA